MGIGEWVFQNWLNIFTIFFGSGLYFTAFSIRQDAKARKEETSARRSANLIAITANHREIWKEYLNNPKLTRVRDAAADTTKQAVTDAEQVFVSLVIAHTNSVYCVMNDKLIVEYEGLCRDISDFFSLPVPKAVWRKSKPLQNRDFAAFIESSLK
jgi:hypothetical protein